MYVEEGKLRRGFYISLELVNYLSLSKAVEELKQDYQITLFGQ